MSKNNLRSLSCKEMRIAKDWAEAELFTDIAPQRDYKNPATPPYDKSLPAARQTSGGHTERLRAATRCYCLGKACCILPIRCRLPCRLISPDCDPGRGGDSRGMPPNCHLPGTRRRVFLKPRASWCSGPGPGLDLQSRGNGLTQGHCGVPASFVPTV